MDNISSFLVNIQIHFEHFNCFALPTKWNCDICTVTSWILRVIVVIVVIEKRRSENNAFYLFSEKLLQSQ